MAISIISIGELYEGVFRTSDPGVAERALKGVLSEVSILGIDEEVARTFDEERAKLRRLGTPMSDLDLLIASTALRHGLTLLTGDKAFQRILRLETIFL